MPRWLPAVIVAGAAVIVLIMLYRWSKKQDFDPDRSPLIAAHTEPELLAILSRPIDGPANCRAVLDFLGAHETGRAAEAVAERIAKELGF